MNKFLPDIYLFNPTCEYAVANGNPSWQPNKILQKMEYDLANLPQYFSGNNDFILTDKKPSNVFLEKLNKINIELPKFIKKQDALQDTSFLSTKKNRLMPWGWSPAAHKLLQSLKESCSVAFKDSAVFNWHDHHKELFSKKFAMQIQNSLLSQIKSDILISKFEMPEICVTRNDFEDLLTRWGQLMVKAPWSSSGRGLQAITKEPVHEKVWEKVLGIVKEQGYAIVEPFQNKELDLSFQFEVISGKINYLGRSIFLTDKKGQYQGHVINGFPENSNPELKRFVNKAEHIILQALIVELQESKLAVYYEGNFGVDMLIFRDKFNQLKINPCLEINVRQNMGMLALQLQKYVLPGTTAFYRTFFNPAPQFQDFTKTMEQKHPLNIMDRRLGKGFLALTDSDANTKFGAYLIV